MKTTLVISDSVMSRLRVQAARSGRTISDLVEGALRRMLDESDADDGDDSTPLPTWDSGGALVDVADRDALYQAMEGR